MGIAGAPEKKVSWGSSLREEADAHLRSCFAQRRPPKVSELAAQLGISRVTLGKRFRRETGAALSEYFMRARIACAKKLLRTTNLSVARIARRAAFKDSRSFHRAFRRETGLTPARYRRTSPLSQQ